MIDYEGHGKAIQGLGVVGWAIIDNPAKWGSLWDWISTHSLVNGSPTAASSQYFKRQIFLNLQWGCVLINPLHFENILSRKCI